MTMKTICSVHDKIIEKSKERFSNNRSFNSLEIDDYKDIINDLEYILSDIYDLVIEAKELWQKMEDWLRSRKSFMVSKWIEEEYQL